MTKRGEAQTFLEQAKLYHGDECLLWPFSHNGLGYGSVGVKGRTTYVHRITCEEENGPPPTPKHEAAHSCGNGHKGCVTRKHLSWKTRINNQSDRDKHGTRVRGTAHGMARLTEDQTDFIRSMRGKMKQRELGEMFGVTQSYVSEVQLGKKRALPAQIRTAP